MRKNELIAAVGDGRQANGAPAMTGRLKSTTRATGRGPGHRPPRRRARPNRSIPKANRSPGRQRHP